MKRTLWCCSIVLLLSVALSAFAAEPRLVKVGAFNYYPAIFQDRDGQIKGFYVDALADLARRENLRIEYVYGSWSEGLERIRTGEVDLLTSVAYTPERASYMDYTKNRLITVWGELYVRPESHIDGIREVEGKKIAVMKGDYNGQNFIDLSRKFDISCHFVELPGFEEVFQAVAAKKVDGGIVNSTFGVPKQRQYGLRSTGVVFNPFDIYLTVAKGKNQELLALVDRYLHDWLHHKDSVYAQARRAWAHGSNDSINEIPGWLKHSATALILLFVAATVFIVLLRRQVSRKTDQIQQREAGLREQSETIRLLLDSTAEAIYRLDRNGSCTLSNAACLQMLGYDQPEQLLGKNIHALIHHTKADGTPFPAEECRILQACTLGEKTHCDSELYWRSDGSCFPVEYWSYPIIQNGKVVGAVVTFLDITERRRFETALRESEERHRSIFENSLSVMLIIDPVTQTIVDANHAATAFYGWTREQLQAMRISDINTLSSEQIAESMRLAQQNNLHHFHFKHRLANGSIRDVEVFSSPIFSSGRQLLFSIIHDITERKLVEETLTFLMRSGDSRHAADFFQLLARYLAETLGMDYVCIDRLEADSLEAQTVAVYHNGVFEDNVRYMLLDTPCGEVVGKTICRFEQGVRQQFPNDQMLQELQAESYVGVTLWGADGQPIGLIAAIGRQPLTDQCPAESMLQLVALRAAAELERKHAEDQLLESEARYKTLLEHAPVAVMINQNNRVVLLNKACLQLFGATDKEQLLGKTPYELFHSNCHEAVCARIATMLLQQAPVPALEETIVRLDGTPVEVEVTAAPFPSKGETGIHVVLRDISERKKAEQAHQQIEEQLRHSQRMEAIGTLAGGIAHDFNNILTAIIGYAHISQMGLPPEAPQRGPIQQITEAANRATHLTRDLLLFSRKQTTVRRVIDLNDCLANTKGFLERIISENIVLEIHFSQEPIKVYADPQQLDQVLLNLAANARDAMPDGGRIALSSELVRLDPDAAVLLGLANAGEYAVIRFADTGKGIEAEDLARVFDPFFTTKEIGKGTGLGLPIVYGIVTGHDGVVKIASTPGQGTELTIYLPCSRDKAPAAKTLVADEPLPRGAETILMAEDSERIREMISQVLAEFGYQVITAVDGEDAVRLFKQHADQIRLLLFDLVMPHLGGPEAYQQIRQIRPDIPVLFTTGYAPQVAEGKLSREQIEQLLHKPYAIVKLLKAVRSALDAQENLR